MTAGGTGTQGGGVRGGLQSVAGFLLRHRVGVLRALVVLLVGIVVLQNVEPTSFDLLFWSLPSVPKLVLILISLAMGAGLWELLRRAW